MHLIERELRRLDVLEDLDHEDDVHGLVGEHIHVADIRDDVGLPRRIDVDFRDSRTHTALNQLRNSTARSDAEDDVPL